MLAIDACSNQGSDKLGTLVFQQKEPWGGGGGEKGGGTLVRCVRPSVLT